MTSRSILTTAILAAAGLALSTPPATAQNANFNYGDLILGFQSKSGTGSDQNVLINLGNTATVFRNANTANSNLFNIVNINSILESTFGAGWYDNTNLLWGAAGVWSNLLEATLQNGDPEQSIYITKARTAVGNENVASSTYTTPTPGASAFTNAANNIMSLNGTFESRAGNPTQFAIANTVANTWEDFTPTSGTFVQSTAFSAFTGGVQQRFTAGSFGTFSSGAVEGALDLYRAQGQNDVPGQFGEGDPLRTGNFQGILTVDQSGNVDFIVTPVPEPSAVGMFAVGSALIGLLRRRRVRTA